MRVAEGFAKAMMVAFASMLVAFCLATPASAQDVVNPKIVLQTLPYGGVEVAAWTRDDRHIITANATTRTVLIWDATSGIIIDRLILPSDNPDAALSVRRLTGIEMSKDGKMAFIHGEAVYATPENPDGTGRALRYELDLQSRSVILGRTVVRRVRRGIAEQANTRIAANAALASIPDFQTLSQAAIALETVYEDTRSMDVDAAEALLPPLPKSNDGKRQLRRDPVGLIVENDDGTKSELNTLRNVRYSDVQLSADGIMLAMVQQDIGQDANGEPVTKVDIFNTETGQFFNQLSLPGDYSQAQWVSDDKIVISQASDSNDRTSDSVWGKGAPPAALGVNAISGEIGLRVEARCFLASAPSMVGVFGAGLANCRNGAGSDRSIQRYDGQAEKWEPFGELQLAPEMIVENLSVSPTANAIAVSTLAKDGSIELVAMDGFVGKILGRIKFPDISYVGKLVIYDDGSVFVSGDGRTAIWFPELGQEGITELPLRSVITKMAETDGAIIAVAGLTDDSIARWNSETDEILPPLEFSNVIAGGFLLDRPVFWAFSALEGLRYWNTSDWSELLTVHFFADGGFLGVTPEGRYDTNLGADANQFRWLVPDRPFQSLAAQTFMRDYFQPGLIERITKCSYEANCTTAFKPLSAIADLNRTLPVVTITEVKAGKTPDEALVTIEVREGVDPDAPNGKTHSGVFNPRIFRDFRFAAHTPDSDFELDQSRARWREVNRMVDDDDKPGDGVHVFEATLYLPTAAGTEEQFISAYAFNEDRIKSDTAYFVYTRPKMEARTPRAFVISMGVDDYPGENLDLNYAAADARLMRQRLAAIPGYDTRTVVATSEKGGKGKVDADTIRLLLAMLNGDVERDEVLKALKADGIDASKLDVVNPDDIVIITFSGHGWTQEQDDFYLLPSDAKWPEGDPAPDIGSLISSSELTMWLRMVNAADIALIIDACHSGASVDSGNFKPGPLGDAGLGQLAYDKGIRILAATQADGVALEIAALEQGLLTNALAGAGEGLEQRDTDLDGDGKISLSEWMAYPKWRLLDYNDDIRLKTGDEADDDSVAFAFPNRSPVKAKKVQQPSVFDFTAPSKVVVRELAP
jgi:uncharacterized caspase-like protein/WD40 repeat protein